MEQSDRARFWLKNLVGPKSGLEGPKRSKNGVLVIFLANSSNDSSDFLFLVRSIWRLSISRCLRVKKKSGWPEIRARRSKKAQKWGLCHFSRQQLQRFIWFLVFYLIYIRAFCFLNPSGEKKLGWPEIRARRSKKVQKRGLSHFSCR